MQKKRDQSNSSTLRYHRRKWAEGASALDWSPAIRIWRTGLSWWSGTQVSQGSAHGVCKAWSQLAARWAGALSCRRIWLQIWLTCFWGWCRRGSLHQAPASSFVSNSLSCFILVSPGAHFWIWSHFPFRIQNYLPLVNIYIPQVTAEELANREFQGAGGAWKHGL